MVDVEESYIKCYPRKDKNGAIQGYQRRVLLSSHGKIGGCPENEIPTPVVVIGEDDYLTLKEAFDTYQNMEKGHQIEVNLLNTQIQTLKEDLEAKEQEIRGAISFISTAWTILSDLKSRKWYQVLRYNPPSLQKLRKPPNTLLTLPEEAPIDQEDL